VSGVISITPEAFAKLVGRDDRDDYVFMVSEAVVRFSKEWSPPVQIRFRREGGALVEMELRSVSADLTLRDLMGQTL